MVKHRKHIESVGSMAAKFIKSVAPWIEFAQQISEKDMAVLPAGRTYTQQAKDFANIVTGRMAGFHLFNGVSDYKPPFTINPAGIANKWTAMNLAFIGYGAVAKRIKVGGQTVLPKGGYMMSLGKRGLPAAVVGGLFDAKTAPDQQAGYVAPQPPDARRITNNNQQLIFSGMTQKGPFE